MRIALSPQRREGSVELSKNSDVLTINGEEFDFSTVPDGATIPVGNVPCEWIVGPVDRIGGDLHITIVLPHGPNPSPDVAYPEPLPNVPDGPVILPGGGNGMDT